MDFENNRLKLHEYLCNLLGSRYCYYSPPTGFEMKYPCIVYKLADIRATHADNIKYLKNVAWTVTLIDRNKNSQLFDKLISEPKFSFDRTFSSESLNHFVFSLYF